MEIHTNDVPAPRPSVARPLRILIADDSLDVTRALKKILDTNPSAWRVCGEARSGGEALQKAAELKPDVVLLDLSIPEPSGLEIARFLQANHPFCAIVLMSAQEPDVLEHIAAAIGVPHCVSKTNVRDMLVPMLESIVGKKCGQAAVSL